jgi:Ca-activated chloride channel homolog
MNAPRINFQAAVMLIAGTIALFLYAGCEKLPDPPPAMPQAYKNMTDDSTTAIKVSIPRIELADTRSTEITIYLSVTDQNGNPFRDFNQYNFLIKQVCVGEVDTEFVALITFNKLDVEGKFIATPLTLDYSGSMLGYTQEMEDAVINFINTKQPDDQVELIKFSSSIEVVQPFTESTATLVDKVREGWNGAWGMTAFYDVTALALDDAGNFMNTHMGSFFPAVIAFTDGQDTYSYSNNMNSVISKSLLFQIPVYTLGFGGANSFVMENIANQTGGRYYYAPDITQLSSLYTLISGQLQNVYVVKWIYDNPGCTEVMIIVEASYECLNGQFYSRVEKIFYPL